MHLCLFKSDLCCLAILFICSELWSIQSSCRKIIGNVSNFLVSQELFKRKLVVYLMLYYSRKNFFRKGFDPKLQWEIYLGVAYGFLHPVCCLFAQTGIFFPLIANMKLFVPIKVLAGKGFCEIFLSLWIIVLCNFWA